MGFFVGKGVLVVMDDSVARWAAAIGAVSEVVGLVEQVAEHGDGVTAAAWLADAQVAVRRLDAARVRLVGVMDRSGVWAEQKFVSPASFLRHELRVEHGAARADLKAAAVLGRLPALAGAFAAGTVSRAAVDRIISVGTRNRTREELLPKFEAIFTDVAVTQSFAILVRMLTLWADQVDPLPIIDDEDRAYERRYLNLTRVTDGWHVEGFLSPEQGAAVAAALNAVITRTRRAANARIDDPDATPDDPDASDVFEADGADGGTADPDGAAPGASDGAAGDSDASNPDAFDVGLLDPGPGLAVVTDWPQDPSQARADALVDLARLAAATGNLPECGGVAPMVVVTVPLARLESDCTTPAADADHGGANHGGADHSGDSADLFENRSAFVSASNGPGQFLVSAKTAQRLTCDCMVHRLVLDPAGLPLDVGRSTRAIPKQLRIALNQRDGGCAYPGCERPPGWTQAHHVEHWARGGLTAIDNLILLCARHHATVHDTEHTITIEPGRRPVITKPRWPNAA